MPEDLKDQFKIQANPYAPAYEPNKWNLDPQKVNDFNQKYHGFFKDGMDRDITKLGQREYALMTNETIFEKGELQERFEKTPEEWNTFKEDATSTFKLDQKHGIDGANCYGYAMNNIDPMGSVGSQHPGDSVIGVDPVSKQELDDMPMIGKIRQASTEEINEMVGKGDGGNADPGLKHLIDNIESEGGKWEGADYPEKIEPDRYRIAVYSSHIMGDYHFVRENNDGTFSHKKGPGEPVSNMGINGEILDSPDDLTGANIGMPAYAHVGYMSVPNDVDVGYKDDRNISDIHTKDEAEFLIGLKDFPDSGSDHEWNKPEERLQNETMPPPPKL